MSPRARAHTSAGRPVDIEIIRAGIHPDVFRMIGEMPDGELWDTTMELLEWSAKRQPLPADVREVINACVDEANARWGRAVVGPPRMYTVGEFAELVRLGQEAFDRGEL